MAAAGQRGEFGTSSVHLAHSIHLLIQGKTKNLRGLIAAPLKSPLGYFQAGQRDFRSRTLIRVTDQHTLT